MRVQLATALRRGAQFAETENGRPLVAQAVQLYRTALQAVTKEANPARWADIHYGLGVTLAHLGDWTDEPEGISLLGEALLALREALTHFSRDVQPLAWAGILQNLGYVHEMLGDRAPHSRAASYRDSLSAFDQALEVLNSEQTTLSNDETRTSRDRVARKLECTGD